LATRRSSTELLLRWRHRLESHQRGPGCNRVPKSSVTVPWLRRRASNPRRRWLTATRSAAELLRTAGADHWDRPRTATGYRPPASGLRTRRTAFIRWRLGDAGRSRSDILRVEGPACSRCTTAPERKVEVSNPHGRTVSLFSKQGAPSQRGIPSGAEGQRIERWRGCPRPSLSKRAPFLSVNPPLYEVGIVTPLPAAPPARFERAPSGVGDRCASSRATGAVGPGSVQSHHPEPTRGPQPYRGCALPTELWRRGLVDWTRTSGLCRRRAVLLSV
jgi:hypothetical protein